MDNPLYDYSAIVNRPKLSLPGDARIAVWFGVNVEHYRFGEPALSLAPFTAELVPDALNYSWRDYGPRVGVFRLMSVFEQAGIPVTGILNSAVCDQYPEVIEHGTKHDWAWVAHGVDNSTWHVGMPRADELEIVRGVTATIEAATGKQPKGWLGPVLTSTLETPDVLAELGYTHVLDWANDDQPYLMNVKHGRLASVPYSLELNDLPAFTIHHQTGPEFADSIVDAVDQLIEDSRESARVLGVGLHPFLVGQPWRARHLVRALEALRGRDDIWFSTSPEIANWFLTTAAAP